MISASKRTLKLNNLKIFMPKVRKSLTNLPKEFCEFPPWFLKKRLTLTCSSTLKIIIALIKN